MVRYNANSTSIRNIKLTDDTAEQRTLIGVNKSGELKIGIDINDPQLLNNYYALIENITYNDKNNIKSLDNFFIKGTNAGFFFNTQTNHFSDHQEWKWVKVQEGVMTLYSKFLITGSEKYLIMAQRRYQNGEQG